MFKKNISDGVGSRNGSNGTPLDPPLFWLDNIFKGYLMIQIPMTWRKIKQVLYYTVMYKKGLRKKTCPTTKSYSVDILCSSNAFSIKMNSQSCLQNVPVPKSLKKKYPRRRSNGYIVFILRTASFVEKGTKGVQYHTNLFPSWFRVFLMTTAPLFSFSAFYFLHF